MVIQFEGLHTKPEAQVLKLRIWTPPTYVGGLKDKRNIKERNRGAQRIPSLALRACVGFLRLAVRLKITTRRNTDLPHNPT